MVIALLLLLLGRLDPVADTICKESSHNWVDAEAVAAVIANRVEAGVRPTPTEVVMQRRQFAHDCDPRTLHMKHYLLAARVHIRWLRPPSWMAKDVLWFCTGGSRVVRTWRKKFSVAGTTMRTRGDRIAHVYWRLDGADRVAYNR